MEKIQTSQEWLQKYQEIKHLAKISLSPHLSWTNKIQKVAN